MALARLVERGLRQSGALDTEALCVVAGRKVCTGIQNVPNPDDTVVGGARATPELGSDRGGARGGGMEGVSKRLECTSCVVQLCVVGPW